MVILLIFMIWYLTKNIRTIFTNLDFITKLNYYDCITIIFLWFIILFNILWIYFLLSKKKIWIKILKTFFIINIIHVIFITTFSLLNFEDSKKSYIESRISKWLNENSERFTPTFIILSWVVSILFLSYIISYINKSKEYFTK